MNPKKHLHPLRVGIKHQVSAYLSSKLTNPVGWIWNWHNKILKLFKETKGSLFKVFLKNKIKVLIIIKGIINYLIAGVTAAF